MQFRVNGLGGIAQGLQLVAETDNDEEASQNLANQAQRLVASDVVYADAFKAAAEEVLEQQGVTNVAIPASVFVQTPELSSPSFWTDSIQRLTQGTETAGLRGNGIASVTVLPGGQELSASGDNTIAVTDDLVFEVVVENSGESQETQVVVRLVIRQQPRISKEQTIDVIASGETKTVRFSGFEEIAFSTQTTLSVTVEPVPGEDEHGQQHPRVPDHLHAQLGGLARIPPVPQGCAARPESGASVAPVTVATGATLRPCLGTTIAPLRRAAFRQAFLAVG